MDTQSINISHIYLVDINKNPNNYNTCNNYDKIPDDYHNYCSKFYSKNWIDNFHSYKKIVIEKPDIKLLWDAFIIGSLNKRVPTIFIEEISDLAYKYTQKYPDIFTNDGYFVRTDKTSLKTGMYGNCKYDSLLKIFYSMVTCKYGHHSFDKDDEIINIYLLEYKNVDINKEFRVFVKNNNITAISQQNIYTKSIFIMSKTFYEKYNLVSDLVKYFELNIKNKLIQYNDYVMDIALIENDFYFIEINPFGAQYSSGSACFNWIKDDNILSSKANIIEFRYVV
jgi:hypothetical protein